MHDHKRSSPAGVLFAGGGTGGHIYPNMAILEALRVIRPELRAHFLVSERPGDAAIMVRLGEPWTASPARPMPSMRQPWTAFPFTQSLPRGITQVRQLLRRHRLAAVVATGGFVSGPAIAGATSLRVPRAMVNLDGVPGLANRMLVRQCTEVFTAYRSVRLPLAHPIGLPLRAASRGATERSAARRALHLDPERPTLLVTGATHGATSIIAAMEALLHDRAIVEALGTWQVLHQCGTYHVPTLQRAYDQAGVHAQVVDYLDAMGQGWAAADLALSRAGAGSVAEAWVNGTPTIFMPNPHHRDQHQRHNAQPMVDSGAAVMLLDAIDPQRNAHRLRSVVLDLLQDSTRRHAMHTAAQQSCPPDGASVVARWLDTTLAASVVRP